MKIHIYVLAKDKGFAPCVENGFCTLTCCKPEIRKKAEVGDYIIGIGGSENVGNNRVIYFMEVTEKSTIEEYSQDERFKNRKDNIYYKDESGNWKIKQNKYHTEKHQTRDLGGKNSLISNNFRYFGNKAKLIPEELFKMIKEEIFNVDPKTNGGWIAQREVIENDNKFKKIMNDLIIALEKEYPLGKYGEPNQPE